MYQLQIKATKGVIGVRKKMQTSADFFEEELPRVRSVEMSIFQGAETDCTNSPTEMHYIIFRKKKTEVKLESWAPTGTQLKPKKTYSLIQTSKQNKCERQSNFGSATSVYAIVLARGFQNGCQNVFMVSQKVSHDFFPHLHDVHGDSIVADRLHRYHGSARYRIHAPS